MVAVALCVVTACAALALGWLRRRDGARWHWAVFGAWLAVAIVTVMSELGRASALDPLTHDMTGAPVATRTLVTGPPAAVFDLPFDVDVLRISPNGRVAAAVRKDADRSAHVRVFHMADARGTFASIEAGDLVLLDDTRALTWTVRQDTSEIAEVDVPSAMPGWRVSVPGMRTGTLTYHVGTNAWTLSGYDSAGRLARATGHVGAGEVRIATAPSSEGAGTIDGWAEAGAAAVMVQNGSPAARIWLSRGAKPLKTQTLIKANCGNDAASERRLLCAIHDGRVARIFTLDAEGAAGGGLAVMDASFEMSDQRAPGWLIGSSNGAPVALRLASAALLQPAATDEEGPPTRLAVSGSILATAAVTDLGARIRVYRVNQF